jgi:aspartyl-tRNA(Asn)/glutamyl-tRNA(Gln) amidotransferase subunit B
LPDDRKARFIDELGLSPYDAGVLVAEKEVADYFETVAGGRDAKVAANWITGDLFGALNKAGLEIASAPVAAKDLGALIDLIADDTISGRIAKGVFDAMFKTGRPPGEIVEEKGLRQVTDSGAIEAIVDTVLEANQHKVEEYRGGKEKLLGFFVGQVMKQSQGKANPKIVNDLLKQKLGNPGA